MTEQELWDRIPANAAQRHEHTVLLSALYIGRAHERQRFESQGISDGIEALIDALERDELTQPVRQLLADFLKDVWGREDLDTAKAVLGRYEPPRRGAPRKEKEFLWHLAEGNYEHFMAEGYGEERALREAWEQYYPDKDFEVESKRPAGTNTTAYVQQIDQFKVWLNANGVRDQPRRGRKPKIKAP